MTKSFDINILLKIKQKIQNMPQNIINEAVVQNSWFSDFSINQAVSAICNSMLCEQNLEQWISHYKYKDIGTKKLGVIMAGNIPLVGFMDLLCAVVSGAEVYIKPSSKDKVLMMWVVEQFNELGRGIKLLDNSVDLDMLIATGSDNANRYFNEVFPTAKKLLRNSRSSVAVLHSEITDNELLELWNDCFMYYGLGCRNVSHLFLHKDFDVCRLVELWKSKTISHPDFMGSYTQKRAMLTMNNESFVDGGYYILHSSSSLFVPLATVSFSYYENAEQVSELIASIKDKLQCVVGQSYIPFGKTQMPELWDWADGEDVMKFIGF